MVSMIQVPMMALLQPNIWMRASYHGRRAISTSSICMKNIRAATPKSTPKRTTKLTYEEANYPYTIGVKKSWNSWNTSNLHQEQERTAETTIEDVFIRKFMKGTWPKLFVSEVIIKRRQNNIIIAGIISQQFLQRKIYFLQGYTEEFLSHILKRPVKLELQTVKSRDDIVIKRI